MKHVLIGLCVPFAVYLLTSFIVWDVNAGNWSDDARFFAVLFSVVPGIGAAVISSALEAANVP